ncbi:MAG: dephospho-CoA kinase [Actinomycetaceae bacterium]|nr:dephospho-CoA kinase [Actinomycetaceae bacterium]MDY6083206.1 dephospho-CoA kinase [Actinomycetaceae bacterium]
MFSIGVFGPIGSGKSRVAHILEEKGAHRIDLDKIGAQVLAPSTEPVAEVEALWPQVVHEGRVDTAALARIVFADGDARHALERIVHPRVWKKADEWLGTMGAKDPSGVAVIESALLPGSTHEWAYHMNLFVNADEQTRLDRLTRLRNMSADDARARMNAQVPESVARQIADVEIDNTGDAEILASEVDYLWSVRLEPFARNLSAMNRSLGPDFPPDPENVIRAMKRLTAYGLDVKSSASGLIVEGKGSAAQFYGAGFVPYQDGYVSADPTYALRVTLEQ